MKPSTDSRFRALRPAGIAKLLGTLCLLLGTSTATAVAIVDIDAQLNNVTGTHVQIVLDAGTYNVTPIDISAGGAFTAWTAWSNLQACQPDHTCSRGWLYHFVYESPSLGVNPIGSLLDRWDSPELAFTTSSPLAFTLTQAETVSFYVGDAFPLDNSGGISLDITALQQPVPEPTSAVLIGSAVLALAIGRKRRS